MGPAVAPNQARRSRALRAFLTGQITSGEIDDELHEAGFPSPGTPEGWLANEIPCLYDDFSDHKAAMSREEWNYAWRLLLLLESGARLAVRRGWAGRGFRFRPWALLSSSSLPWPSGVPARLFWPLSCRCGLSRC